MAMERGGKDTRIPRCPIGWPLNSESAGRSFLSEGPRYLIAKGFRPPGPALRSGQRSLGQAPACRGSDDLFLGLCLGRRGLDHFFLMSRHGEPLAVPRRYRSAINSAARRLLLRNSAAHFASFLILTVLLPVTVLVSSASWAETELEASIPLFKTPKALSVVREALFEHCPVPRTNWLVVLPTPSRKGRAIERNARSRLG